MSSRLRTLCNKLLEIAKIHATCSSEDEARIIFASSSLLVAACEAGLQYKLEGIVRVTRGDPDIIASNYEQVVKELAAQGFPDVSDLVGVPGSLLCSDPSCLEKLAFAVVMVPERLKALAEIPQEARASLVRSSIASLGPASSVRQSVASSVGGASLVSAAAPAPAPPARASQQSLGVRKPRTAPVASVASSSASLPATKRAPLPAKPRATAKPASAAAVPRPASAPAPAPAPSAAPSLPVDRKASLKEAVRQLLAEAEADVSLELPVALEEDSRSQVGLSASLTRTEGSQGAGTSKAATAAVADKKSWLVESGQMDPGAVRAASLAGPPQPRGGATAAMPSAGRVPPRRPPSAPRYPPSRGALRAARSLSLYENQLGVELSGRHGFPSFIDGNDTLRAAEAIGAIVPLPGPGGIQQAAAAALRGAGSDRMSAALRDRLEGVLRMQLERENTRLTERRLAEEESDYLRRAGMMKEQVERLALADSKRDAALRDKAAEARAKSSAHWRRVEAQRRQKARERKLQAVRARRLRTATLSDLAARDALMEALEAKKEEVLAERSLRRAVGAQKMVVRREEAAESFQKLLGVLGVLTDKIVEEKRMRKLAEAESTLQHRAYKKEVHELRDKRVEEQLDRLFGTLEAKGRREVEANATRARARAMALVEA